MEIIRLPRVCDDWFTSPIFSLPWFPPIMSRDRFFKISRYLDLLDATKQKERRGSVGRTQFQVFHSCNKKNHLKKGGDLDFNFWSPYSHKVTQYYVSHRYFCAAVMQTMIIGK